MKKITLLIVDDEKRIGQLIARLIHWDAYNLESLGVYDNSEQAYGAILLHHPDIVISDIKMPVMDGLELVRRVLDSNLHPHFIFVSGFREFEYAHTALKYGVEDYLLKPIQEEELNAVLARVTQTHSEGIRRVQEEKRLQEAAHIGQLVTSADAMASLEHAEQPIDWDAFNKTYRLNVAPGRMLAVMVWLDYEHSEERDAIQDRLVINNTITMMENRLRPFIREQIYAITEKCGILAALNYPAGASEGIVRKLHTAFSEIKQYLAAFQAYRVTMSLGVECERDQVAESIACARHRIRQRILLGVDRMIYGTIWQAPPAACAQLYEEEKYQMRNSIESFSPQGLTDLLAQKRAQMQQVPSIDPANYYLLADTLTAAFFGTLEKVPSNIQAHRQMQETLHQCWTVASLFQTLQANFTEILKTMEAGQQQRVTRPIREAEHYVAAHYGEKITLEDLAAHLQLNPSYFSSLFKQQTGKNFQSYLQDYRMEKAKELLRTTNETMMSIAEKVGYTDTRYFSQSFAKVVGIKPSLYRKLYS